MESTEKAQTPPTGEEIIQNQAWWNTLSDPWKQSFNEVERGLSSIEIPDDLILQKIVTSKILRFAGPSAPFPNMTLELEDISGLKDLQHVEILVFSFNKLRELTTISHWNQLRSLFVFNNEITSLEGLEQLEDLTELYINGNKVSSLLPLKNLTKLQSLYCNFNQLETLEGIGAQHRANLKNFVCLPNDKLFSSAIIQMEQEFGIRCAKG